MLTENLLDDLKELKKQAELLKQQIEEKQEKVIIGLQAMGANDAVVGKWRVKFASIVRQDFDYKEAAKTIPAHLMAPYYKQISYTRLTVN